MKNREGEIGYTNIGTKLTIISYRNSKDITVRMDNGYIFDTKYYLFKNGEIKTPYDKTVCKIGYLGVGKYEARKEGKFTISYTHWKTMLNRCCSNYNKELRPTYKDCTVCEEWHNFQNFGKWFDDNYYQIDNEIMCLDKDILYKGNKIYSPETCIFVPSRINTLFVKSDKVRGNLPIGVGYHKQHNKYRSYCNTTDLNGNRNQKHLGYFKTIEEAFLAYKTFKEQYIKQVADEYKNKIPKKLYDAMYNYKVEITD